MRVNTIISVLLMLALTLSNGALSTMAQDSQPVESPQSTPELPEPLRAALNSVEDFSFSFANPGFFAVLEYVKTMSDTPGLSDDARFVDDWTALLERSADFRGLPVTIEGVVGKNKAWQFEQPQYKHLGPVWQLELSKRGQPLAATVILTQNAADVPVGSLIRVTGYFVMIRQYHGANQKTLQAALLVGHGPTLISRAAPPAAASKLTDHAAGLIIAALAAAVILWLIVRRSAAKTTHDVRSLHASRPAPLNLSDDLARWASHARESQDESVGNDYTPDSERPSFD